MVIQNIHKNFNKFLFSLIMFGLFYYWGFVYKFDFLEKGFATFFNLQYSIIVNGEIMGLSFFELAVFLLFILLTICTIWTVITSTSSYLQNKSQFINNICIFANAIAMFIFLMIVVFLYRPKIDFIIISGISFALNIYLLVVVIKSILKDKNNKNQK